MKAYEDPDHPDNGPEYHTGKPCIEPGCDRSAGTLWSPLWCQPCNTIRICKVSEALKKLSESIR